MSREVASDFGAKWDWQPASKSLNAVLRLFILLGTTMH